MQGNPFVIDMKRMDGISRFVSKMYENQGWVSSLICPSDIEDEIGPNTQVRQMLGPLDLRAPGCIKSGRVHPKIGAAVEFGRVNN